MATESTALAHMVLQLTEKLETDNRPEQIIRRKGFCVMREIKSMKNRIANYDKKYAVGAEGWSGAGVGLLGTDERIAIKKELDSEWQNWPDDDGETQEDAALALLTPKSEPELGQATRRSSRISAQGQLSKAGQKATTLHNYDTKSTISESSSTPSSNSASFAQIRRSQRTATKQAKPGIYAESSDDSDDKEVADEDEIGHDYQNWPDVDVEMEDDTW